MAGASVQKWRRNIKKKAIEAFGGKCIVCAYDKCDKALDFHHLDPSKKDFSIGQVTESPVAITKIADELEKCVMLCANCHREYHAGLVNDDKLEITFNKDVFLHKDVKAQLFHACATCGKETSLARITCSSACSGKRASKVKWDGVDLAALIEDNTIHQVADMFGVADSAVRKRCKKLGLRYRNKENWPT